MTTINAAPLSVFDEIVEHHKTIPEYSDAQGRRHPATHRAQGSIAVDVQDITANDVQRLAYGEYQFGDRRVFTNARLEPHDWLIFAGGHVWEVLSTASATSLLAPERMEYVIRRISSP